MRVPKGLQLQLDGSHLQAEIKEESDSEFVDMMDHRPVGAPSIPLASSFKLTWVLDPIFHGRPVGLRRITIGYAHEGLSILSQS